MSEKIELFSPEGCLSCYKISSKGTIYNLMSKKYVGGVSHRGYRNFTVRINGKRKQYSLANVMAQLFNLEGTYSRQVIYIDGDKLNCNLDNLEWATPEYYADRNKKHRWKQT